MYFSILGDSISTFKGYNPTGYAVYYEGERCLQTGVTKVEDTWWSQVIKHFGGTLLSNASYSGSLVEGSAFPAGCSSERIAALSCGDISPDIIVVFMGINDYGRGGARDQATEADFSKQVGNAELENFRRAYMLLLERAQTRYPSAELWCCTLCPGRVADKTSPTFPINLRGVSFLAYNDVIRSSAETYRARLIDLAAQGFDYESLDGTHPHARGMSQLARLAVRAYEGSFIDLSHELGGSLFDASLRSQEICLDNVCLKCKDASNTGSNWLLVCEKLVEKKCPR